MAATIIPVAGTTAVSRGAAARRPLTIAGTGKAAMVYLATVTGDASYPNTGAQSARGYDISGALGPWDILYKNQYGVNVIGSIAPGGTGGATAGNAVTGIVDLTNKRLRLYVNGTEVADTVDVHLLSVILVAYGA